jgi:PIN domain nuclease of toxin-antitoxin system
MRLLLDTAALIYALEEPSRLSKRAASIWQNPGNTLEVSAVSISEIAIKVRVGKLDFSALTLQQALDNLAIDILPYSAEHAFKLFELPLHHRDPFDRQIIAQALYEDTPVLTPDPKFGLYRGIKVLW